MIFAGQTVWITQASTAANRKLINFLTPCGSVSFTQELHVGHTGTTRLKISSHTTQSCCFTSPTQSINQAGSLLGCHDGRNNCSSKANHGDQVVQSFKN